MSEPTPKKPCKRTKRKPKAGIEEALKAGHTVAISVLAAYKIVSPMIKRLRKKP